jgi:Tfp pilus assembly protein PilF
LLAQGGQMPQAEQACAQALQVDPTAPGLHHLYATVLDALGRKQAMISDAWRRRHRRARGLWTSIPRAWPP